MKSYTLASSSIAAFIVCVALVPAAAKATDATELEPDNPIGVRTEH